MEVEIISDSSTFQKMRDEWNGLASNFHSPLLRHEWFAACIEAFSSKRHPPTIIAVRSGGRLRAAAPLVTMHLGLVPHMEILGAEVFGEPCGFLYDSQAALMTLFQAILERRRWWVQVMSATALARVAPGVRKPRVFLGRVLSLSATASKSLWL